MSRRFSWRALGVVLAVGLAAATAGCQHDTEYRFAEEQGQFSTLISAQQLIATCQLQPSDYVMVDLTYPEFRQAAKGMTCQQIRDLLPEYRATHSEYSFIFDNPGSTTEAPQLDGLQYALLYTYPKGGPSTSDYGDIRVVDFVTSDLLRSHRELISWPDSRSSTPLTAAQLAAFRAQLEPLTTWGAAWTGTATPDLQISCWTVAVVTADGVVHDWGGSWLRYDEYHTIPTGLLGVYNAFLSLG